MNAAEIKMDLFRKLDSLNGQNLQEAYGLILNFLNGATEPDEWGNLTQPQKEAIKKGLEQLNNGLGKNHNDVMANVRKRFSND